METKRCRIAYRHDFPDYPCKICSPEEYKKWEEDRAKRKSIFISKVLSLNHGGADENKIIEEASKKWEEVNKI